MTKAFPLLLAALLPLAACAKTEVVEPTAAPTTTRGWTLDGPGSRLAADEMQASLLTQEDVRKAGWEPDTVDTEPDPPDAKRDWYLEFDPPACGAWWADYALDSDIEGKEQAKGITYMVGTDADADTYVEIAEDVWSFDTPEHANAYLTFQGEGLTKCPTFSLKKDKDDLDGTFTKILDLRPGDASATWHMEFTDNTSKRGYQMDTTLVQIGRNLVKVAVWHHGKVTADQLRSLVDVAVARLEEGAKLH